MGFVFEVSGSMADSVIDLSIKYYYIIFTTLFLLKYYCTFINNCFIFLKGIFSIFKSFPNF